jgi:UDP-glucose 4-epimerase
MSKESVVVYGGSGFLGSHVADSLTECGFSVRIFDLRESPYISPDQEMIVGDMSDIDAVIKAAKGCRYVYNFAGISDIDEASKNPMGTVQMNILGNIHALEAARISDCERFVFASSVYVYSDAGSFYRASKKACENYVEAYHERYQMAYTILRYGSLYGRRADMRNAIYNFLFQAIKDKKIYYSGDGAASREYIHVTDAARLSVKILSNEFMNRHITLTGPEKMSVGNLLQMISEMMGRTVRIEFGEKLDGSHYLMTPYAYQPKIGHKLVDNSFVDLGQGLIDCMAELQEKLNE